MNSICKVEFMNEIWYYVRSIYEKKSSGKSLEMTTCMSSLTVMEKKDAHTPLPLPLPVTTTTAVTVDIFMLK